MRYKTTLALLFFWKLIDTLISILAPFFVPYLGFFSYADTMHRYNLPAFIRSLSNFDGIMYVRISLVGYEQYEQAYFPGYPILIRALTPFTVNNPIIAGVAISLVAFGFASWVLTKLFKKLKFQHSVWFFILLLTYPTSFFFGVMYTESLFLLFFVTSIYFLLKKQYFLAAFFGYLTGLTRVVGVLTIFLFGTYLLSEIYLNRKASFSQIFKQILGPLLVVISPLLGLATYSAYLWQKYGDALYFFHAQEYFGAQRSTSFIVLPQVFYRYLKIFLTADKSFQYWVAFIEVTFFVFAFTILILDLYKIYKSRKQIDIFRLGLNLFSFANLIVPTLTGTFTAIPRYSMLSLSIFFFLAEIKSRNVKIILASIFAAIHIVFLSLFIQGYYLT